MKVILNLDQATLALTTVGGGIPCQMVGFMEQPDGTFALGVDQTDEQRAQVLAKLVEMGMMTEEQVVESAAAMEAAAAAAQQQAQEGDVAPQPNRVPAPPKRPDIVIVGDQTALCTVCHRPLTAHREQCKVPGQV
jgi:hypothetical protein